MFLDATGIKVSIYGLTEATEICADRTLLADVVGVPHEFSRVTTSRGVFNVVLSVDLTVDGDDEPWTDIIADTDDRDDLAAIIESLYDYNGPLC